VVAGFIDHDLACAACSYNLRTQPYDGRCPECGCDVARTLIAGPSPVDTALHQASWMLLIAGIGLTLLCAGFAIACGLAGVTSDDIYSGPTTRYGADFAWLYDRFHLGSVPWLALAGFPTCIVLAIACHVRRLHADAIRCWGAMLLTVAYAVAWMSI